MTYAWIIDKDHIAEPGAKAGTNSNAVGVHGPRGAHEALTDALHDGKGIKFRMLDDDGEVYYEGRLVDVQNIDATDLSDAPGVEGFEPLDDYGTPNAGAAIIQYRDGDQWEIL